MSSDDDTTKDLLKKLVTMETTRKDSWHLSKSIPIGVVMTLVLVILAFGRMQLEFEQMKEKVNLLIPRQQEEIVIVVKDLSNELESRFLDIDYRLGGINTRVTKNKFYSSGNTDNIFILRAKIKEVTEDVNALEKDIQRSTP